MVQIVVHGFLLRFGWKLLVAIFVLWMKISSILIFLILATKRLPGGRITKLSHNRRITHVILNQQFYCPDTLFIGIHTDVPPDFSSHSGPGFCPHPLSPYRVKSRTYYLTREKSAWHLQKIWCHGVRRLRKIPNRKLAIWSDCFTSNNDSLSRVAVFLLGYFSFLTRLEG